MQIFQMQSSLQFEEDLEQMHICIYLILTINRFFGGEGSSCKPTDQPNKSQPNPLQTLAVGVAAQLQDAVLSDNILRYIPFFTLFFVFITLTWCDFTLSVTENPDRAVMSSEGTGFSMGQRGQDSSGEDFEEVFRERGRGGRRKKI